MLVSDALSRDLLAPGTSVPFVRRAGLAASSDRDLVALVRGGSAVAFRELYRRHAECIARITFRVLGSEADLDDVVQETFVDAHRGLASLDDASLVRAWLIAIALRKARRLLGKQRRRAMVARFFGELEPKTTDARLATHARELKDALDRVDPDARIPWVLTRVCDMSLEEAADACGVSLATVKRRIALAEERIRRRLGDDAT